MITPRQCRTLSSRPLSLVTMALLAASPCFAQQSSPPAAPSPGAAKADVLPSDILSLCGFTNVRVQANLAPDLLPRWPSVIRDITSLINADANAAGYTVVSDASAQNDPVIRLEVAFPMKPAADTPGQIDNRSVYLLRLNVFQLANMVSTPSRLLWVNTYQKAAVIPANAGIDVVQAKALELVKALLEDGKRARAYEQLPPPPQPVKKPMKKP